ncbi:serine/threonine-protein kinase [Spiractinospora alimapuensis]|uniref:serine/threonine-protein kinase n=1 Tax=Spiractinospora alimapuensis TaxID=2820884 RepID=UPI001F238046|nr:serine/threonine-protein kinase [Spiractinospora alimapuensis]
MTTDPRVRATHEDEGFDSRYQLHHFPLGRGGMGEVWEAVDNRLGRTVAVKFVRFPTPEPDLELVRRFRREARVTAALHHPGVPIVYDSGTHAGRPYLVMERVEGISISDLLAERGALSAGWTACVGAQTCAVLTAAHNASLVHRDLKPENLILQPEGTVKVLDFGLAMGEGLPELSRITQTGQALGTPAYMAPEQIQSGQTTASSDLYALGCSLFEMLTARRPFAGATSYALMIKHVSERPPRVRQLRSTVPAPLAELVGALLEKDPRDRPGAADEVYRGLLPFVDDLDPLPGLVPLSEEVEPARMYVAAASRLMSGAESASARGPAPEPPSTGSTARPAAGPTGARPDLAAVRAEAERLKARSRYPQAAELLGRAVRDARHTHDATDPAVVDVWWDWANALFETGEYQAAAPAFASLADALAGRPDADLDLVFRCRRQYATCLAFSGDNAGAQDLMRRLVADAAQTLGPADDRTLSLRRQLGTLMLRVGDPHASDHLRQLHADLVRLRGPDDAAARQVYALLSRTTRPPG